MTVSTPGTNDPMTSVTMSAPACTLCGQSLAAFRYGFAFSTHQMQLLPGTGGDGRQPQQTLKIKGTKVVARYCSHACCKIDLSHQLDVHGYPESLQHNRIAELVVCPCVHCGKPVDLTQPHVAIQKNKHTQVDINDDSTVDVHWADVLAVQCANCSALAAQLGQGQSLNVARLLAQADQAAGACSDSGACTLAERSLTERSLT